MTSLRSGWAEIYYFEFETTLLKAYTVEERDPWLFAINKGCWGGSATGITGVNTVEPSATDRPGIGRLSKSLELLSTP